MSSVPSEPAPPMAEDFAERSLPAVRPIARPVWIAAVFYACAVLVAVLVAFLLRGRHPGSLADLANLMGPLSESLAHGGGYKVCTDAMTAAGDSVCYHAARMPLPPLLLAGLIRFFDNLYWPVEVVKIALVLLPVFAAVMLVSCRLTEPASLKVRLFVPALLFAALLLPTQLVDAMNMQVEEGYSFCLLTYAVAVLLFGFLGSSVSWRVTVLFGLSVLALYLTKSSMIAVVAFLVLMFCLRTRMWWKRATVIALVVCGPLGWGMYTLEATGHFSVGTSLDGINLHKGNNPKFLDRYPPADGGSLDRYDGELNVGQHFSNEWKFNAFHMRAAERYMRSHWARTAQAGLRKAQVFFISFRKIGSQQYSGWLDAVTWISMVLFRTLLWSACALALWLLFRGAGESRMAAFVYLGTVVTVAMPYLAGFALTRHASVLALPSALFLCWGVSVRGAISARSDSPASLDGVRVLAQ